MATENSEKRIYANGCYAVVIHLQTAKRFQAAALVIALLGILCVVLSGNVLYIAAAVALGVAAYFVLRHSCVHFVARQTGMLPYEQYACVKRYKLDSRFARDVDKMRDAAAKLDD